MAEPLDLGPLVCSTGRLIRAGAAALEVGPDWAEDTAQVVLFQPEIRDGQRALTLLKEMAAEHHPVPRRPGSHDLVCAKCGTGWECELAERLRAVAA